jgi:hypothetical protein
MSSLQKNAAAKTEYNVTRILKKHEAKQFQRAGLKL